MSRIHEDHNGVSVLHTSEYGNSGHDYLVGRGENSAFHIMADISFQNGAVKANGVNGITSEALLAILIHRTEALNERFSCKENEEAIACLKGALNAFESRTKGRIDRGVEGLEKE